MGEEAEFRRQIAALEARFLRPQRWDLDELGARLGDARTGPELWQRAATLGVIPSDWVDDPRRRFRASAAQLRALGQRARCAGEWAAPPSKQSAHLLASDPEGLAEAERLARLVAARLEPWGGPRVTRVRWRIGGHAEDLPHAGRPPLGALAEPLARLFAALGGPRRVHEHDHAHPRFQPIVDLLTWARRLRHLGQDEVPAEVRTGSGLVRLGPAIVGRAFAELADPIAPWLELSMSGYALWAVWGQGSSARIELAAPFAPRRDPGRWLGGRWHGEGQPERPRPRAVWSARTSALRLAAARGDLGTLRRLLPLQPRVPECGEPSLTSYAVYGGRAALEVLADHDWLELEARDASGKTPLMLAMYSMPSGPAGGQPEEFEVPISRTESANVCRYLARAGADLEARDPVGSTAVHWAVRGWNLAGLDALLRCGAKVDAQDYRGRTALMKAIELEPGFPPELYIDALLPAEPEISPVVERLLDAKPDTDIRDAQGWTVLHVLARETAGGVPGTLIRRLAERGVVPSRDRLGASPAELCLRCFDRRHRDGGPFDPRTGVAAGPGPEPRLDPPAGLVDRLVEGLLEARARGRPTRTQLDDWLVWSDWLQGQGDPRGELVAVSVARAGLGGGARRRLDARVAELEARCVVALDRGLEPLVHGQRPAQVWTANAGVLPRLERTHGFIGAARIPGQDRSFRSAAELVRATACLLAHEPLVASLEVGSQAWLRPREDPFDWAELVAGLAQLRPHSGVRELALRALPPSPVELVGLERAFPKAHRLVLLAHRRLAGVRVRWPGLKTLHVSHGRRERGDRSSDFEFELELPDLVRLDLDFPVDAREMESALDLASLGEALERLPVLRELRVRATRVAFVVWLAESKLLPRLRSLELDVPSAMILTLVRDHAEAFAGLDELVLVSMVSEGPAGATLDAIRERLPMLEHQVWRSPTRGPIAMRW